MNTRRRYCRVAIVGKFFFGFLEEFAIIFEYKDTFIDGCLYAVGGFDTNTYQASVERLDPRESRWSNIPSMNNRRSSGGVAALNGSLYCVGGTDGQMCMSTGERFNVQRNAWEPIASMTSKR